MSSPVSPYNWVEVDMRHAFESQEQREDFLAEHAGMLNLPSGKTADGVLESN